MALRRMLPFHDMMAARPDIQYSLHLLGDYRYDREEIDSRSYVHEGLPRRRARDEVWLFRGWNTPRQVLAAWEARVRRLPLMLWHEVPGVTYEAVTWKKWGRVRLREMVLPQIFRAYRGCVLLGIGELATRRFAELAPGSRVHLLPYPDHQADALLSQSPAKHADSGGDGARLIFVGQFSRRKGVDLLAAACERLWQEGEAFTVRYVGRGPMEAMLREHAKHSNGRAQVLGSVTGEALFDVFAASDGLVLPSRWDGWGLVIHEALAAGLPVVVSDNCGAKMLCNGSGMVIAAGNSESMVRGLRWITSLSHEERDRIGAGAREVAAGLTMDRIADALVGYAEEALLARRANSHLAAE